MTAQVAVINKTAVALATDSAVSIGSKVYNTSDKLFPLSKTEPVGIMVYGGANLVGLPWETIIKEYRNELADDYCDTLNDYCDDFVEFVSEYTKRITNPELNSYIANVTLRFCGKLRDQFSEVIRAEIAKNKSCSLTKMRATLRQILTLNREALDSAKFCDGMSATQSKSISRKFKKTIVNNAGAVFGQYPLTTLEKSRVADIIGLLVTKRITREDCTGVVIAGFGRSEIYPSIKTYNVNFALDGRLQCFAVDRTPLAVGIDVNSAILSFAQKEMVTTFMEGIDPSLRRAYEELCDSAIDSCVDEFSKISEAGKTRGKSKISKKLAVAANAVKDKLKNELEKFRYDFITSPIVSMTGHLPKDEMAGVAEALVNLTSVKRHVSNGRETVGGPIDVAVISKGDGFVWIKRQTYFDAPLNYQFLGNYFSHRR